MSYMPGPYPPARTITQTGRARPILASQRTPVDSFTNRRSPRGFSFQTDDAVDGRSFGRFQPLRVFKVPGLPIEPPFAARRSARRLRRKPRAVKEALVAMRRHLHAQPELSMHEFATAAYVLERLRGLPFDEIRANVAETGILATLRGAQPGPVTLLRADMDALPIQETSDAPYRSQNPGVMHACGHDGHVSI